MKLTLKDKQNWQGFSQIHQDRRQRLQINKTKNGNREITTYSTKIQRVIREYCEQLYAYQSESIEEKDKSL